MQYSIRDEAGMTLAESFYRSIARGEAIDAAQQRRATGAGKTIDTGYRQLF